MSQNNFNWHSEEDLAWDEEPEQPETAVSHRGRFLVLFLFTLTLIGAAGWVISTQVQQRVDVATSRMESDVLASHNLVLDAAVHNDGELMRSVLSGRDDDWVDMQEALTNAGAFLDRSLLGLELQPAAAAPPPTTTLNPELTSAEVVFFRGYQVTDAAGNSESVTLQHTAVYRRGSQRWLYAPPTAEFWGARITSRGQSLTLHYLAREDPWGGRLANDLESLLHQICRTYDELACPDDLHLHLHLEPDADALNVLLDPTYSWQTDEWSLTLPALTLVGMPLDEAGYQALYRAYGAQMTKALVSTLVAYNCCEQAPLLYQALLDYELFQLGLQSWPVQTGDLWTVFGVQPRISLLLADWDEVSGDNMAAEDKDLIYALVDFLLSNQLPYPDSVEPAEITPVHLQRSLVTAANARAWIGNAFPDWAERRSTYSIIAALETEWWHYAQQRTETAVNAPPIPFPAQDLLISCPNPGEAEDTPTGTLLLRYNPETDAWMEEGELNGLALVSVLSDDATRLYNTIDFADERWELNVWRDGVETAVAAGDPFLLSLGQLDPNERWLTVFYGSEADNQAQFGVVDLQNCSGSACELTQLFGQPYWAPDGAHVILAQPQDPQDFFQTVQPANGRYVMLNLPSAAELPSAYNLRLATDPLQPDSMLDIGSGVAPFWLDAATFGYLQFSWEEQAVVLASVDDAEPEVLLTRADLHAALPEDGPPLTSLLLGYAFPDPLQTHRLFVVVYDVSESAAYVFAHDRQSGTSELFLQAHYESNHAVGFAPDRQWLMLLGSDREADQFARPRSLLSLRNLRTDEAFDYYLGDTLGFFGLWQYDWAADGQWLAFQVGQRGVGLAVPGTDYQQLVTHAWEECYSIAWVERAE